MEQHRITKPNLTVAIRLTVILLILKVLSFNYFITHVLMYPVIYQISNYLYVPIDILTIVVFLLFARYLENFTLKTNYRVWIYLIVAIVAADFALVTADKVFRSLQEPQGTGLLGLLDSFDHPYRKPIAICLSIVSTLKAVLFFIFGVMLLSFKKEDFVGGLANLGVFLVIYSSCYLVSYVVGILVAYFRALSSLSGTFDAISLVCNISSCLIIAGIGNTFYKAKSYNEKIDGTSLRTK